MGELAELLDRGTPWAGDDAALPPVAAAELDALTGRWARWVAARDDVHWGVRARALVGSGEPDAARALLAERIADDAAGGWTPQGLAAAVWAASRVGPHDAPAVLCSELGPAADGVLVDGFLVDGDVPLAPVAQLRGLLAAASGDLDAAADELRDAAVVGDARAPVWGALARLELARVLVGTDDDVGVRAALSSARTFFAAAGYAALLGRCDELVAAPDPLAIAAPRLGHLVAGQRWTVGFGVEPAVDVAATKGMVALAHLIRCRDRQVPAIEIDHVLAGRPSAELVDELRVLASADDPDRMLTDRLSDDAARSRVTKLLRRTVASLGEQHRLLGTHLQASVSTGHLCSYDADAAVRWRM